MATLPIDEQTLALVQDLIDKARTLSFGTIHLTVELQIPVHNGKVVGYEMIGLPKVRLSDVKPKGNLVS